MPTPSLALSMIYASSIGVASAQTQMIERSVKELSARTRKCGICLSVLPDCTSDTLPTIRLASP